MRLGEISDLQINRDNLQPVRPVNRAASRQSDQPRPQSPPFGIVDRVTISEAARIAYRQGLQANVRTPVIDTLTYTPDRGTFETAKSLEYRQSPRRLK